MPPDLDHRIDARIGRLDWERALTELDEAGWARLGRVLTPTEARGVIASYDEAGRFRSTVDMARHRFGRGEYRYFGYPLPPLVAALRTALYPRLAALANRWMRALGRADTYPATLAAYLARCHAGGQRRPTPLVLRYGAGDYNCLHQDLYGDLAFPLQVVVPLSEPGRDYAGGELIFAEQRPRSQSRATAVVAAAGEAIAFTNRERPVRGERLALGLIFHDAR